MNFFQACVVVPIPLRLTAVISSVPSTRTFTVLTVPKMPPGLEALPTEKVRV